MWGANRIRYLSPRFRASASKSGQVAAFATGVLSNIYEFHLYTGNSTTLSFSFRLLASGKAQYSAFAILVFLPISTHFTSPPEIPYTSTYLKPRSFFCGPSVELKYFTKDFLNRLQTLYAQSIRITLASANSVPAAAVIRRMQVLFGMIGRKASVGCIESLLLNASAQLGLRKRNF